MSAAYICISGGVNLDITKFRILYLLNSIYVSRLLLRVHVKGIVLLICIVRKSGVVSSLRLSRAIEILVFSCQQSYNNEVHRNYCMRSYVSTIAYNVFLSNFCFCCLEHFFSPTDSCFSRWKLTNLNNFPNSVDISLSRL